MIVGFQGHLGAGKTLGMIIWGYYYSLRCKGANILSNLPLRKGYYARQRAVNPDFWLAHYKSVDDFLYLVERGGGICLFDEFHLAADNRSWARKEQIYLTEFLMYLRKMGTPLFFTSQTVKNQVDVRLRATMDLIIDCQKTKAGFIYTVWDAKEGLYLGRKFFPMRVAQLFYNVYDSYKIITPVDFPSTERAFKQFITDLDTAVAKAYGSREAPIPDIFRVGWTPEPEGDVAL